jgi:hypothetical protein
MGNGLYIPTNWYSSGSYANALYSANFEKCGFTFSVAPGTNSDSESIIAFSAMDPNSNLGIGGQIMFF